MIIEIALGIVLAVLILAFWPFILGLGLIAIVIAVAAAVLYFVFTSPEYLAIIAFIFVMVALPTLSRRFTPKLERFIDLRTNAFSCFWEEYGNRLFFAFMAFSLLFVAWVFYMSEHP